MNSDIAKSGRRADLVDQWAEKHGSAAADRLAAAEDLADAVAQEITPPNTVETYTKGWRVWLRYTQEQGLPELEGSRGALVAYAVWLLERGCQPTETGERRGYAPAAAHSHITAVVLGLRLRGVQVSKDAASEARTALDGLTVKLLKAGERRGRGQAPAASLDGLRTIASACDTTLTGRRDLALVLLSFHLAARASEPAGLLAGDVRLQPRGLIVSILTGKTALSVRHPKIPYGEDPELCPVRAWKHWRATLIAECGAQYDDPADPAFHQIDRWGRVGGAMSPDAVTQAITRISVRAGVAIRWTGHSLRAGLATVGRAKGKDSLVIARQGGWAPNSKVMLGYMRSEDDWEDNASKGLA